MITVSEQNAPRFLDWIKNRGGVARWEAIDFSGSSCCTPALTESGEPMTKPHWGYPSTPNEIETDPAKIMVYAAKEVTRFHVATRLGAQGFRVKVTDGGSRRIERELAKRPGSWYAFDYEDEKNCVIYVAAEEYPLSEYKEK